MFVLIFSARKDKKSKPVLNGFDKGYKAQSILGATDSAGGELHFLISWYNFILSHFHGCAHFHKKTIGVIQ